MYRFVSCVPLWGKLKLCLDILKTEFVCGLDIANLYSQISVCPVPLASNAEPKTPHVTPAACRGFRAGVLLDTYISSQGTTGCVSRRTPARKPRQAAGVTCGVFGSALLANGTGHTEICEYKLAMSRPHTNSVLRMSRHSFSLPQRGTHETNLYIYTKTTELALAQLKNPKKAK
jgi:hypothetical protein